MDQQREKFEAHASSKGWRLERAAQWAGQPHDEQPYNSTKTNGAWLGWQAALATPAAPEGAASELPPLPEPCKFRVNHWTYSDVQMEEYGRACMAIGKACAAQAVMPEANQKPYGWLTGESTSHRQGHLEHVTNYEFAKEICDENNKLNRQYDPEHQDVAPIPLYAAPQPIQVAPAVAAVVKPWEQRLKEFLSPGLYEALGEHAYAISGKYMEAEISDWRALTAHDEYAATRLRQVCKMVGLEKAVPEDDHELWGCAFSVLGMIRHTLSAAVPPAKEQSEPTDSELLDFVQAHPEMRLGYHKRRWHFVGFTNYEFDTFKTVREAIAAAARQGGQHD